MFGINILGFWSHIKMKVLDKNVKFRFFNEKNKKGVVIDYDLYNPSKRGSFDTFEIRRSIQKESEEEIKELRNNFNFLKNNQKKV